MNEKSIISLIPGAVVLAEKIAVFIPATVGGAEVDNSGAVDRAAALLSGFFGGATIQPGAGCWLSDSGALVKEATTTVYRADRFASKSLLNHGLSWCVILLVGKEK